MSFKQLKVLVKYSRNVLTKNERLLFNVVTSTPFYGFLRPSEYCISTTGHQLLKKNANFDRDSVLLTLTSFKHARECAKVVVRATNDRTCPVRHMNRYIQQDRLEDHCLRFRITLSNLYLVWLVPIVKQIALPLIH